MPLLAAVVIVSGLSLPRLGVCAAKRKWIGAPPPRNVNRQTIVRVFTHSDPHIVPQPTGAKPVNNLRGPIYAVLHDIYGNWIESAERNATRRGRRRSEGALVAEALATIPQLVHAFPMLDVAAHSGRRSDTRREAFGKHFVASRRAEHQKQNEAILRREPTRIYADANINGVYFETLLSIAREPQFNSSRRAHSREGRWREAYLRETIQDRDVALLAAEIEARLSPSSLIPGFVDAALALKSAGILQGIVSNLQPFAIDGHVPALLGTELRRRRRVSSRDMFDPDVVLRTLGIDPNLVFRSYRYGAKPGPGMFRTATQALSERGIEPAATLMTGNDRRYDGIQALGQGWQFAETAVSRTHYRPRPGDPAVANVTPTMIFTDWTQVSDAVISLQQ